jgi:hypothetical protein
LSALYSLHRHHVARRLMKGVSSRIPSAGPVTAARCTSRICRHIGSRRSITPWRRAKSRFLSERAGSRRTDRSSTPRITSGTRNGAGARSCVTRPTERSSASSRYPCPIRRA